MRNNSFISDRSAKESSAIISALSLVVAGDMEKQTHELVNEQKRQRDDRQVTGIANHIRLKTEIPNDPLLSAPSRGSRWRHQSCKQRPRISDNAITIHNKFQHNNDRNADASYMILTANRFRDLEDLTESDPNQTKAVQQQKM